MKYFTCIFGKSNTKQIKHNSASSLSNYGILHDERVWAPQGADEVTYDVYQNYPEKSRFTAIATISVEGEKFDLIIIAKGPTIRCEK